MTLRRLVGSRPAHVPSADWGRAHLSAFLSVRASPEAAAELERTAAAELGFAFLALGSCRTAIWAALTTAPGLRRVWVPAYTCVAVPNAVSAAGLEIAWVDVDGANLDMESVLARAQPGDALIAQHTYGIPIDSALLVEARRQGIYVLEDRAHRFDADDIVGDATVLSLEHSKVVSGGQGGLVHAADSAQMSAIEELRRGLRPVTDSVARSVVMTSVGQLVFDWRGPLLDRAGATARRLLLRLPATSIAGQTEDELGGQGITPTASHPRLARLAAIGIRRHAANLDHRRQLVSIYAGRLTAHTPTWVPRDRPLVRFPVLVDDAERAWHAIRGRGIDLGPRWFAAPVHPAGSRSTYVPGSAPNAERLARSVLTLPTHPRVSRDDAREIAEVVAAVAERA